MKLPVFHLLDIMGEAWGARHLTDATQMILGQVPMRASARGVLILDGVSVVRLTLWALLCWERKLGLIALERVGVDRFGLARELDGLMEIRTGEPYGPADFTSLIEPLLRQAEREAAELGNNWVGSEHLSLAIVRTADPELASLLRRHGATYERVREAIVERFRPS
jgi:ATP-dependent Clp protease ATP-binding subunit ClpA